MANGLAGLARILAGAFGAQGVAGQALVGQQAEQQQQQALQQLFQQEQFKSIFRERKETPAAKLERSKELAQFKSSLKKEKPEVRNIFLDTPLDVDDESFGVRLQSNFPTFGVKKIEGLVNSRRSLINEARGGRFGIPFLGKDVEALDPREVFKGISPPTKAPPLGARPPLGVQPPAGAQPTPLGAQPPAPAAPFRIQPPPGAQREDEAAIRWLEANPNDPRAPQVRALLRGR